MSRALPMALPEEVALIVGRAVAQGDANTTRCVLAALDRRAQARRRGDAKGMRAIERALVRQYDPTLASSVASLAHMQWVRDVIHHLKRRLRCAGLDVRMHVERQSGSALVALRPCVSQDEQAVVVFVNLPGVPDRPVAIGIVRDEQVLSRCVLGDTVGLTASRVVEAVWAHLSLGHWSRRPHTGEA